ncbi:hypothetical protein FRC11_000872 [Ceratobasidium sp. 423]|nr:hypothetical protein FRC11_000872 [Ceratobasidium sp. 423]
MMPSPPDGSHPQDDHTHPSQIHSHVQPENTQPGYYQHPHALHNQLSPHPTHPPSFPFDPVLVGTHQQLLHSLGRGPDGHPTGFGQPRQPPMAQSHTAETQFPMNQQAHQFAQSQEPGDGPDDTDKDGEGDGPVAGGNDGKGNKKQPMECTDGPTAKKLELNPELEQGVGGEGSGISASAANPKPKSTRGSRACINCRRLKMKCVGADKVSGEKCDRCRSNNRECRFEESRVHNCNCGQRRAILMHRLKHIEETLDMLIRTIAHLGLNSPPTGTITGSPTSSSPPVQALMGLPSAGTPNMANTSASPPQKSCVTPPSNSPRLHILPDNTLTPLGPRAEDSLMNRHEKGAPSGIGGMLPGNINEDGGGGEVGSRPVGVASAEYSKLGCAGGI